MDIKADLTWLQKHERLLLIFLAIVVVLWLGNKYENLVSDENVGKNAVAQEQLKQQIQTNKEQAAQYATLKRNLIRKKLLGTNKN